jgi:hypothetical protein
MLLYNFHANGKAISFTLEGFKDIGELRPLFGSSMGGYRATDEIITKNGNTVCYHFESFKWPILGYSYVIDIKTARINKRMTVADVTVQGINSTLADIVSGIKDNKSVTFLSKLDS